MTGEEKQKAINALKKSAPIMAMTQEEFNDYIHTLNKIMDWLEQDTVSKESYDHEYFLRKEFEIKIDELQHQLEEQVVKTKSILDKVRDEIKFKMEIQLKGEDESEWNKCISEVLEIIDKYRESEKEMKIIFIEYNGTEHHVNCVSFEFRTNQVSNWVKIKYKDGRQEMIHEIATIKSESEE